MHFRTVISVGLLCVLSGCARSEERVYTVQGQVIAVAANRMEATINHEEIRGLMPAMTMPYKVRDRSLLEAIAPGDLVTARLVIVTNDAYLTEVKKVGEAPLAAPAAAPSASSGFELLEPGEAVPDADFVDQDGTKRPFSSFKGSTVVVTFMYTKCPLPTFCPLMDRHFAAIQQRLAGRADLASIRLVSITLDPSTDTPSILTQHARTLGANPKRWTFLTGDRDVIDQFASRFGLTVSRALDNQNDITHTLRTAIVDREGRLSKLYVGNEWSPDQLLADLEKTGSGLVSGAGRPSI